MNRIESIISLFPKGNDLLDIGSDHGYLGISLLKSSISKRVINLEKSLCSLKFSFNKYSELGLLEKGQFLLGDGFEIKSELTKGGMKNDAKPVIHWSQTTVVIAGLGSSTIVEILQNCPENLNSLIILSHTLSFWIRKWALKWGWKIDNEIYSEESKKAYIAIRLCRGLEQYTEEELVFGKERWRESQPDLFLQVWKPELKRLRNIPLENRKPAQKLIISFLDS